VIEIFIYLIVINNSNFIIVGEIGINRSLLPPLLLYFSNFPFIIYVFGCPENAQRNHLNYTIIYIAFSLAVLQLIILWYQGDSLKCKN